MGVSHGFVEKSGAWYSYNGERIGQGKDNVREFLKQNRDIAAAIEERIRTEVLGKAPATVVEEEAEAEA
jgi:recombination protein RecA